MIKQHTLANKVSCIGVGLHSGSQVSLSLNPAPVNSGIVFRRLDVPKTVSRIAARHNAVSDTRLGTTISNESGTSVATVEHLMAALWGTGVDNAVVELDGPEVPIMDGSSEPFVFMIECAGLKTQSAPRRVLHLLKPVEVSEGSSFARAEPNAEGDEGCVLDIEIEYDNTLIPHQFARYDFREVTFKQSVSRARTFGFEHEVLKLREMGLARGGSLENAIVVSGDKVLNKEGLRYPNEFVRHKILDCIGDIYLAGAQLKGHFIGYRSGHGMNNRLLRAVFSDRSAWRFANA